jgi:TorA maturation chaperone TorD
MLAPMIPHKEPSMSEQGTLFEPHPPVWVRRLWSRIDAAVRQQVISMLAQMARAPLNWSADERREERSDES